MKEAQVGSLTSCQIVKRGVAKPRVTFLQERICYHLRHKCCVPHWMVDEADEIDRADFRHYLL